MHLILNENLLSSPVPEAPATVELGASAIASPEPTKNRRWSFAMKIVNRELEVPWQSG
jgi:hypothetical protein